MCKYVLDVQLNVVGNCLLFYRQNGHGYTCDLDEAHEFTKQEAKEYVAMAHGKYRMWRKDALVKVARRHVDAGMAYQTTQAVDYQNYSLLDFCKQILTARFNRDLPQDEDLVKIQGHIADRELCNISHPEPRTGVTTRLIGTAVWLLATKRCFKLYVIGDCGIIADVIKSELERLEIPIERANPKVQFFSKSPDQCHTPSPYRAVICDANYPHDSSKPVVLGIPAGCEQENK